MYRILLADDEGIMLESLKKIIETEYGNECEIHCAKSGRVVVEMQQNLMYNRKLRIMRSLHQIQRIAFRTKQVQMKQIQTKKSLQRKDYPQTL